MVPVWCLSECVSECSIQLTADKMQNKFLYFVSPTSWNKCTLYNQKKIFKLHQHSNWNMVSAEWNKKYCTKKLSRIQVHTFIIIANCKCKKITSSKCQLIEFPKAIPKKMHKLIYLLHIITSTWSNADMPQFLFN